MGQTGVVLTAKQRKAFEFLSFKYGNGGSMCSNDNHKFLMLLVNGDLAGASLYCHRVTPSCLEAYERIMKNDFKELKVSQMVVVDAVKEE